MPQDDVLHRVRAAREAYARSLSYDVRAMVADLRARDAAGDWPVVRHPARRCRPVSKEANTPNNPLSQTAAS
jgi:hypothetical protein